MSGKPLELMVRKLRLRTALADEAAAAILSLQYVQRSHKPHACLIREGQTSLDRCAFIIEGWAIRQKVGQQVGRQVVSIHMPGDFLDLQQLFLRHADHGVKALTDLKVIEFDRLALRELAQAQPQIGVALWIDSLVEASIYREWIANRGRDAKARIAHLFCELAERERLMGLSDHSSFVLPVTQEQLGDAVGITNVHVSRSLKTLTEDGVIRKTKRVVSLSNWSAALEAGDFDDSYLHHDLRGHENG